MVSELIAFWSCPTTGQYYGRLRHLAKTRTDITCVSGNIFGRPQFEQGYLRGPVREPFSFWRSIGPGLKPNQGQPVLKGCEVAEDRAATHRCHLKDSGWRDAGSWRNSAIADCRARADGAIAARSSGPSRPRWRYLLCTRLRPPQRFRDRNWSHCSLASGRMGCGRLLGTGRRASVSGQAPWQSTR